LGVPSLEQLPGTTAPPPKPHKQVQIGKQILSTQEQQPHAQPPQIAQRVPAATAGQAQKRGANPTARTKSTAPRQADGRIAEIQGTGGPLPNQ
jgi:hypothetical protein